MLANATQLPTLRGERVQLRALVETDAAALFEIFSDPEVTRYWSHPAWEGLDQAKELAARVHRCFAERSLFQWGVTHLQDADTPDKVIGHVTLASLDAANGRAEIGFSLAKDQWGKGLAQASTGLALDFAFSTLGLRRIEADVDPRNAPSIALLERLGFQREGLARERWCVAGEIQDSLMMGLLRREWT